MIVTIPILYDSMTYDHNYDPMTVAVRERLMARLAARPRPGQWPDAGAAESRGEV